MPKPMNRRTFLKSASMAAAPSLIVGRAWAQDAAQASPNSQVTLGCIGMGNHGTNWNLAAFLRIPEARVIAVCDVFADRRERACKLVNDAYGNRDCDVHADFREILARDDIDAVVISTPDHWHVLMAVMAARAGKDVFCEKPTLNIEQGRILTEVMKETGVVYQGGIEDRSVEQYHRLAELVRNGRIGKLDRILITMPEGKIYPKEEEVPVPEGLDYDMWLGPARYTPYTPTKLGPMEWRNQWDFSGGLLTDWGAHLMDTAQVALFEELGGPVEVDGTGHFPEDALSETASTYKVRYRYGSGVEMTVESGGTGIRFEGAEGWAECPSWRAPLKSSDPEILETTYEADETKLWPRPPSEHVDFINAVKSRERTTYGPEDIHRLSTTIHLGNISMRLNRKLDWDPVRQEIKGDDEAYEYFSCPLRGPWSFDA